MDEVNWRKECGEWCNFEPFKSVQTKVYKNMLPESTQLLQYSLSDVRNVVYLATIDVPSLDTKSLKFPIYIF